jgi:protein-S-isoprenylcysteine O-methyltransferase Ste14
MMWAWALFRRTGTPIRPTDSATTIVAAGPFRISRNPMVLGILFMLLGIAWAVGTWPMLIAPAGFLLVMSAVFIPYEEKRLEANLGVSYNVYRKRVRRWI